MKQITEEIVNHYLPVINRLAGGINLPNQNIINKDDLKQEAILGLYNGINTFKENKKSNLDTWCYNKIYWSMIDSIRFFCCYSKTTTNRIKIYKKAIKSLEQKLGRYPTIDEISIVMDLSY